MLPDYWGLGRPDGTLDRPINDQWFLPSRIEVEGNRLIWSTGAEEFMDWDGELVRPAPGLLSDFIRLADGPDRRILQYAQRWGVLNICSHGLPASHQPYLVDKDEQDSRPESQDRRLSGCGDLLRWRHDSSEVEYWEPLDAWRHYARHALAILNVAARLKEGEKGRPEDVTALEIGYSANFVDTTSAEQNFFGFSSSYSPIHLDHITGSFIVDHVISFELNHSSVDTNEYSIQQTKNWIAYCVNLWLSMSGISPMFFWDGAPRVTFGGHSLFAALGFQILLNITSTDALDICSSCGLPYPPSRRPKSDGRRYCDDCGKRAAWKDASRDYRNRQKRLRQPPSSK